MKSSFGALAITLGIFLITGMPANAERYLGGQIGFVKPNDQKNVEGVGNAKGITFQERITKGSWSSLQQVGELSLNWNRD